MLFAKGCFWWIFIPLIIAFSFMILTFYIGMIFLIGLLSFGFITIFFMIFFRDPHRKIGHGIVAPADGKIRDIIFNDTVCFISIFMDLHNVHVNRMPISGQIINMRHFPGKHLRAWRKESDQNERVIIDVSTDIGTIKIIQLAGLIARRIYPYVRKGDTLEKGKKIGIIRLGSRVDIYLPVLKIKSVPLRVGDKVFAGITTIAEINKFKKIMI
jgi:phosphatidylserine decarboxylase